MPFGNFVVEDPAVSIRICTAVVLNKTALGGSTEDSLASTF